MDQAVAKAIAEVDLIRARAQVERAKAQAELEVAKALAEVELAKAAAQLQVVKLSREVEVVKATGQLNFMRVSGEVEVVKAAGELDLARVVAELEVAKALAQLELVNATSELEVAKKVAEVNIIKAAAEWDLVKDQIEKTVPMIPETTLQDEKLMQDVDSDSLKSTGDQSEEERAPFDLSDSESKDLGDTASTTAVFGIILETKEVEASKEDNVSEKETKEVEASKEDNVSEKETKEMEASPEDNVSEKETKEMEAPPEDNVSEKEMGESRTTEEQGVIESKERAFEAQVFHDRFQQASLYEQMRGEKALSVKSGPSLVPVKDFFFSVSEHFGKSLWANYPYTKLGLYSASDLYRPGLSLGFQDEMMIFEAQSFANSIGFTLRQVDCRRRLFGLNVFYDYLKECHGLHQIGFGGECRNKCFELYFNAFFPVARKSGFGKTFFYDGYKGPFWVYITPVEFLYRGLDFAVGKRRCFCRDFDFSGFLGGYYLDSSFNCRTLGFQAFGEISWCSRFFAGFLLTNDSFCGRLTEGYFGITFPFSVPGACCHSCDCRCFREGLIPRLSTGVRGCAAYYKKNW